MADVELKQSTNLAAERPQGTLNRDAKEFALPTARLKMHSVNSGGDTMNHESAE